MYSCKILVPDPGGGGWGARATPTPHEEDVSVLKQFAHCMYGNSLMEFGVVWVVWGVSMDRTTVMLKDQIRKRVCLAL